MTHPVIVEMQKFTHIMLDLETMSTKSDSAILAIGACVFYPGYEHPISEKFYTAINPLSAAECGHMDVGTIKWWMEQESDAKKAAWTGNASLQKALYQFHDWIKSVEIPEKPAMVWGNGADFDNVILTHAYNYCTIPLPWNFRNNMCYRTLKNLQERKKAPSHNALQDAIDQAEHAQKIFMSYV